MKRTRLSVLLAACLLPSVLAGCADELDNVYSTEHNPEYKITYLLTEFETPNHHNAEGRAADEGRGYLYMFDDPNTDLDYVEPRAKHSKMCQKEDEDGNLMLDILDPYPPECSINTGYDINDANPFEKFGSSRSFHMKGTVDGEGLGFGVYFSSYLFYARRDDDDSSKLKRDDKGNIPAFFSDGRYDEEDGEPLCSDDWMFSSAVDPKFKDEDNRHIFKDEYENDVRGKYVVSGAAYGPGATMYSEGWIWEDESGREEFELKHPLKNEYNEDVMKEPRCLGEWGQEGFVMWATGNNVVEVVLSMPESAPITDGGICDEDAMEKCFDYHKKRFVLDGEWREYHASWDEFLQEGWGKAVKFDPNRIINIQVKVVAPENGTKNFDIWLDHIGFYGGKEWPFMEKLADTEWMVEDTETETETETGAAEDSDSASASDTTDSESASEATDTGSGEDTTDTGTGEDTTDTGTGEDTTDTESAQDTGTATE